MDTGIERRENEPEFYGAIPDGDGGSIVFICMVLNSALLLLVRSSSTALLMTMDKKYALYYTAGDAGFFFFQKLLRNDIHFFMNVGGWASVVVCDFLVQFMYKTIVDYTGLIQFRGAGVLGGMFWSFSMVRNNRPPCNAPTNTFVLFCAHSLAAHHPGRLPRRH